jgi:hypothetical protein
VLIAVNDTREGMEGRQITKYKSPGNDRLKILTYKDTLLSLMPHKKAVVKNVYRNTFITSRIVLILFIIVLEAEYKSLYNPNNGKLQM